MKRAFIAFDGMMEPYDCIILEVVRKNGQALYRTESIDGRRLDILESAITAVYYKATRTFYLPDRVMRDLKRRDDI